LPVSNLLGPFVSRQAGLSSARRPVAPSLAAGGGSLRVNDGGSRLG